MTSHVKPGDAVVAGDLLADLDGKELRWQLASAIAQREAALEKARPSTGDQR